MSRRGQQTIAAALRGLRRPPPTEAEVREFTLMVEASAASLLARGDADPEAWRPIRETALMLEELNPGWLDAAMAGEVSEANRRVRSPTWAALRRLRRENR